MSTQAQQAGPGPCGDSVPPMGSEAAGPADPRLVIKEVGFSFDREMVQARATVALGSRRFSGVAAGRPGVDHTWQLAAAASVAALQQYLQQCAADPAPPQIQLLDIATTTTGIGHEVVLARLRLSHGSKRTDLLGSALVRNDRCSTAVAAALDAASRRLGMFRLSASSAQEEDRAGLPAPAPATSIRAPGPERQGPHLDFVEDRPAVDRPTDCEAPRAASPDPARTFSETPSLGIAISPTSIRAAAVDSDGKILAESRRSSPASANAEATVARACEAVREAIAGINGSAANPSALGLAVPGRLRPRDGICVSCGEFPSWREVQLAAPFAEEFGLPVSLISPTQAAALAEIEFGAARGTSDLVFVRIGVDIEVAVIVNGQPLQLPRSGAAHAGHVVIEADGPRCVCGENGCWQVLANREALVARTLKALRRGTPSTVGAAVDGRYGAITPALIVRLAAGGDSVARGAVEETGRYLAIGLANLITLFDPEAVVVDSAPRPVGVALLHAAEATLKSSPRAQALARCVLLSPELGDAAPVLGAAAWAAQSAVRSPTPPSEPDVAAYAYQDPALPFPAPISHSGNAPNPGGSGSSYR